MEVTSHTLTTGSCGLSTSVGTLTQSICFRISLREVGQHSSSGREDLSHLR